MSEAEQVAQILRDRLGSWTLGELGRDGIYDAIWDEYPPFKKMSESKRQDLEEDVAAEIFG